MLTVMVVNGERYLLNEDSAAIDKDAQDILDAYPVDADVYFTEVTDADINPHKKIKALW